MEVNLQQMENQAKKVSAKAEGSEQTADGLHMFCRADEMLDNETTVESPAQKINTPSVGPDGLSSDTESVAKEVKCEDLDVAKAELANAIYAYDRAKQNYIKAQNLCYNNPSDSMEINMETAKRDYYSALNDYNLATAKVRSLS